MTFGPYPATVEKLIDGDTLDLAVDLGFSITLHQRVRLYGINAPEKNTPAGKEALTFVQSVCPVGAKVTLVSHGWDKYGGRCDGDVILPDEAGTGTSIAGLLAAAGHAKPWLGKGARP